MIAHTRKKRTNREQKDIKFRWLAKWIEYMNTIPQGKQLALFNAIAQYGLYCIKPTDLTGETEQYFINEVCPELDRQRKRREECKRL